MFMRGVDAFFVLLSVLVFIDALCASTATIQRLEHLIIRNTLMLSDREKFDAPSGEGRSFRRW